jgi:putative transposase
MLWLGFAGSRIAECSNISPAELTLRLAECRWRREAKWLAEVPFGSLQQSLRNLQRAQTGYGSAQTRPPVFKKRGLSESFRYGTF